MSEPIVIGRYMMCDAIGGGGMAKVYLGRILGAAGFSRVIAIKRMHPDRAHDRDFATMLVDEARLASRIRHPNVVPVLDVVRSGRELLLIMEYVHGVPLDALLDMAIARGTRLPLPVIIRIALDMLAGLQSAHDARGERGEPLQLVHRDISPHNVLVGVDGAARIIDFGIAKAARKLATTQAGQIKGKLSYMAPEQLRAQAVDRRTDIYAMGLVLWELVVGKRAIEPTAPSLPAAVRQVLNAKIPRPSELVDVPAALDDIIMTALRPSPEERFPTADAMASAIEAACEPARAKTLAATVESLAADVLAQRSKIVRTVESVSIVEKVPPSASDAINDDTVPVTPPQPATPRMAPPMATPMPPVAPAMGAPTPVRPTAPSMPGRPSAPSMLAQPSAPSIESDVLVPAGVPSRSSGALLLGAALLVAVVLATSAYVYASRRGAGVPPQAASSAPSNDATGAAALRARPVPPAPTLSDEPPASLAAPSGAPSSSTSTAASTSTRPIRRAGPSTSTSASAKPPAPNCDPPYAIDSTGIRIPRRECLQP